MLRLEFTDTVQVIKEKIRAHINAPESAQINIIEVQLLQNYFCQLLNPMSAMDGEKLAKDTEFSNKSTWMVLVD